MMATTITIKPDISKLMLRQGHANGGLKSKEKANMIRWDINNQQESSQNPRNK
jgi:hypothetical protein